MDEIINWVTSWDPQLTDFSYEAIDGVNLDTLPEVKWGIMVPFNQALKSLTKSACTIVNSARNLLYIASAFYGYKPKAQDIIDAVNFAVTQKYVPWQWWMVTYGVDAVRKRWNTNHPDQQMTSYNIKRDNLDFAELLVKWYPMTGSYWGWNDYNEDYRKDAILDWSVFKDRDYWHCTIWRHKWKLVVDDSYDGNSYNIYEVKQAWWLIKNWVWNPNFYFYTPFNPKSDEIKRLSSIIANCTTQNSCVETLKKLSSDKNFQNEQDILYHCNMKKIQQSQEMLGKL